MPPSDNRKVIDLVLILLITVLLWHLAGVLGTVTVVLLLGIGFMHAAAANGFLIFFLYILYALSGVGTIFCAIAPVVLAWKRLSRW